jgi:hypothetical protein
MIFIFILIVIIGFILISFSNKNSNDNYEKERQKLKAELDLCKLNDSLPSFGIGKFKILSCFEKDLELSEDEFTQYHSYNRYKLKPNEYQISLVLYRSGIDKNNIVYSEYFKFKTFYINIPNTKYEPNELIELDFTKYELEKKQYHAYYESIIQQLWLNKK